MFGFVMLLGAISATGQAILDSIEALSDDALLLIPGALAAGVALWGVTILIRFARRVFGAAT